MEERSSPAWMMVPELNDGEGVDSLGREATLGSGEALRPVHGEKGGVRWLGTDGAAENRGGVAVTAYRRKAAVGGGGEGPAQRRVDGMDGTARPWQLALGRAVPAARARASADDAASGCCDGLVWRQCTQGVVL
jgi:hypothetical protein